MTMTFAEKIEPSRFIPANDVKVGDILVSHSPDLRPVQSIRETPKRRYVTINGAEAAGFLDRRARVLTIVS